MFLYPFENTDWEKILTKNGLIKVGDVVYRFFEEDRLYTENNETENLIAVNSKADYENYNIKLKNNEFPLLKSIAITYPTCVISQGWEERSDDSDDYRIESKMWYYCYQGYNINMVHRKNAYLK